MLNIVLAAMLATSGAHGATVPTSPVWPSSHARGHTGPTRSAVDSLDVQLYARILKSADQRVLDSALIVTSLASTNPEIRRVAARTLSQVALRHRTTAIPMLRAIARDADTVVASSAIFGLGLVRDTASIPLLASVIRNSAPIGPSAAWSLGEIGAPAGDSIAALLGDSAARRNRGGAAAVALLAAASKIRPLDFGAVRPYIQATDATVRWAAAYAVARQRSRAGARALLDAVAPDPAFRAELARELTSQVAGDSLHDVALARLRKLVLDRSAYVRINALRSIATFGVVARDPVLHGLRDRDANVRIAASQSVASAFDTARSPWSEAWSGDTSYKIRKSLIESATAAGYALPGAATWRASPDWRLRQAALAAWSGARDTAQARTVALASVRDTDARVRGAAYAVLAASDTARRDSIVQRALAAALSDPDSIVRTSVADARSSSRDTASVDRPLAWYIDAVRRIVIPSLRGRPLRATMQTGRGQIVITLDGVRAPLTVLNYATLSQRHFYDGLRFHRVVPGFVAQDGDPRGDGEGGPGYAIRDELTLLPYSRGAVGMALSGPDTGGSQYFLTLTPQPHLTGHYTVFGNVTSGLSAMDALVEGDAIRSVVVQ